VKTRLTQIFLVLFALWPLVHYGAVVRYGTDPWKLGGWGMYCVPGPMKTLRLVVESEGGVLEVIDPRSYSPRESRAASKFVEYRRALGWLARPEALVATFFAERPDLESVGVRLVTLKLDPDSARLVVSEEYGHFERYE
jgi:hypothetical protein